MMNFISLVLGIVLGELMFTAALCVLMMQPTVIKWIMKYYVKQMQIIAKTDFDEVFDDVKEA